MVQFIDVRTATVQKEDAQKIAKALVDQRCAASSQISGPIESTYWWKGEMVTAEEWVVTAKTRIELYQKAEALIRQLHPYEEPGITAFPIIAGSPRYFQWISQKTTMQATELPSHNSADIKEQIIREFDDAYEQLVRAATTAAKRGVESQNGEWGPREVLAHIAGWAAQATTQLPQIIKGLPPIAYASEAQHAGLDEAANNAFMALIGNQTFEEVLSIAHKTHIEFVTMLKAQDKNNFLPNHYVYDRMKRVIEHHLQHAHELDQLCHWQRQYKKSQHRGADIMVSYELMHGDTQLGTLTRYGIDQPWILCHFTAKLAFEIDRIKLSIAFQPLERS